eukprot:362599-Chlamydomonas_euryale.AAC.2
MSGSAEASAINFPWSSTLLRPPHPPHTYARATYPSTLPAPERQHQRFRRPRQAGQLRRQKRLKVRRRKVEPRRAHTSAGAPPTQPRPHRRRSKAERSVERERPKGARARRARRPCRLHNLPEALQCVCEG